MKKPSGNNNTNSGSPDYRLHAYIARGSCFTKAAMQQAPFLPVTDEEVTIKSLMCPRDNTVPVTRPQTEEVPGGVTRTEQMWHMVTQGLAGPYWGCAKPIGSGKTREGKPNSSSR